MTRRRGAFRRAVAALGLITSTVGLAACSGAGSSGSGAPTTRQIRAALSAHARALITHDRSAFLGGVSSAPASSAFAKRQQAAYANLVKVPLASWSYAIDVRTDDRGAEETASKKYGSTAWIMHVYLHYALRDIDPKPALESLYLTFVRRNGSVVLAGDTDLAEDGGPTWRGPWDYGTLDVAQGSRVVVLGHPAQAASLAGIVADVDAAIPKVTAVWGTGWPQRVAVLVPSSTDELASDAGPTSQITSDVPAVTVSAGADELTRAALGLRLIVNPPALAGLTALGRMIVLRHEITHIAAGAVTSDSSPRWLVEGFADYVGQLDIAQTVPTIAAELAKVVRAGKVPTQLPTETDFDAQATAAQSYEEGWLACRLIAKDAGQAGLVRFYRMVGASYDADNAIPDALRSIVHQSLAQFTASWRAYLVAQLR